MSRFPDEFHLSSWAGVSPGSSESAGKRRSGRVTRGNRNLKNILINAAWTAARTKNTYLNAKFTAVSGRRGKKRSIMALAHKILVISYHVLKQKQPYRDLGSQYLHERNLEAAARSHTRRLESLGFKVTLEPTA